MSISNALVIVVEDAAVVAWNRLPKTRGLVLPPGIPPTNEHILPTYCALVCKELLNNGVASARVITGQAYGAPHTWLTIAADETEETMVVDLSTPSAGALNLVASDETRAYAHERGLPAYYRSLSIIAVSNCADVYIEGITVEAPAVSYATITQALVRLLASRVEPVSLGDMADGDEKDASQQYLAEVLTCLVPPLHSSFPYPENANPFVLRMVRLLKLFFDSCLGHTDCSFVAHERLLLEVDRSWVYLFGGTNAWVSNQNALTVVHHLSSAESADIDAACAAYQQIRLAIITVGEHTRALTLTTPAPLSSLELERDWRPSVAFLFAVFEYVSANGSGFDFPTHLHELGKTYSKVIVATLELVARIALRNFDPHFQAPAAQQQLYTQKAVLLQSIRVTDREVCENLFTFIAQYLENDRGHSRIPEFHTMLVWWAEFEYQNHDFLFAAYDNAQSVADATAENGGKSEDAAPVHITGLQITFAPTGCRVSEIGPIEDDVACDKYKDSFCDYAGTVWDILVNYAPRNVASGEFHVFLDSLGIKHSDKIARIDTIMVFPMEPTNTNPHLSVLLNPLIETLCKLSPLNEADTWGLFNERARRAVQMLHHFDREVLETVVIPCPKSFVLDNVNPTLHVVDQWLTYFSHIPSSARRVLDIQRKKFGAYFRLFDDNVRIYMSISLRPPPKFLTTPEFKLSVSDYDQQVSELIWDWLTVDDTVESALLHVHGGVVTEHALKSMVVHRSILESKHLNPKFSRLRKLFESTIHRGMVFSSGKNNIIELEIYRDASFFFEVEYMKVVEKLRVAAAVGQCAETSGLPTMIISGGFRKPTKTPVFSSRAVIMSANDWDDSVLEFLAKWVRVHFHHAAHETLVALQVTNSLVSFLPTVPFVCRERDVYFMTSVYLHNACGDTHNTFCSSALPTYDRDSMAYTVDLGEEFAYWFSNRALTYTTSERTRTTIAPFTRVSGKVYLCCSGVPPAVICKFEGDYEVGEALRGDLTITADARHGKHGDDLGRYNAYIAEHATVMLDIMCLNEDDPGVERATLAARSMAIAKYFQSFRGMPMHRTLLKHVPEDAYKKMVVGEYYGNKFMHPRVTSIACRFTVAKFSNIMYGVKNTFVNSMQ